MLADFHFLRPYWFVALVPVLLLFVALFRRQPGDQTWGGQNWARVCDPALLPYILTAAANSKRYLEIGILNIIALLAVLALAGPTWQQIPQPLYQPQSALVIALDLSYSMLAKDIKPSRFERAKYKIADLINLRVEGQTALLVYADDAFTVTPLTDDTATIHSQLKALSPDIMPIADNSSGITQTGAAIKKATALLKQAGPARFSDGHILLVTDAVHRQHQRDFQQALDQGYSISILGVGTEEGAPVRLSDGGLLKDAAGAIVIAKLDQTNLRRLAGLSGGRYARNQLNDDDIAQLQRFFMQGVEVGQADENACPAGVGECRENAHEKTAHEKNDHEKNEHEKNEHSEWHEFAPWLILLIIPLAAFGFRRGYISLLLGLLLGMTAGTDPAMAFVWDDVWLNQSQRTFKQDYGGDDQGATAILEQQRKVIALYNEGNALAKQADYQAAIDAYNAVLATQTEHETEHEARHKIVGQVFEDAQHNKNLIEKILQEQQASDQDQTGQEGEGQEGEGQEQEGQKGQEGEAGQGQEGQEGEGQIGEMAESESESQDPAEDQDQYAIQNDTSEDTAADASEDTAEDATEDSELIAAKIPQQQTLDEAEQAAEQWLRRIPDDPAVLLRRKFQYQYRQRQTQQ